MSEQKKSNLADLEQIKPVLWQSALLIAICLALVFIEWEREGRPSTARGELVAVVFEYDEPAPVPVILRPPPPPNASKQIWVHPDSDSLDASATPQDRGADENTAVLSEQLKAQILAGKIFEHPQRHAEFPGGMPALQEYLKETRQMPDSLVGKVFVQFVITREGLVRQPKVIQSNNAHLDSLALTMVAKFPPWKPATIEGMAVNSRFVLPIIFIQ